MISKLGLNDSSARSSITPFDYVHNSKTPNIAKTRTRSERDMMIQMVTRS